MTLEQQFRDWVDRAPGINFGNLDYALKNPESIAFDAFLAFKAGVKAGKAMRMTLPRDERNVIVQPRRAGHKAISAGTAGAPVAQSSLEISPREKRRPIRYRGSQQRD